MTSSRPIAVRPGRPDDADAVAALAHAKPTNARALAFYKKIGAINVPAVNHAIFGEPFDRLAREAEDKA